MLGRFLPKPGNPEHAVAAGLFIADDAGETPWVLCDDCLRRNLKYRHFCRQCGKPLSAYATIAPLESIYTEGYGYAKSVERPSRTHLIGMWCIFGPGVVFGLVIMVMAGVAATQEIGASHTRAVERSIVSLPSSGPVVTFEPQRHQSFGDQVTLIVSVLLLVGATALQGLILYKVTRNYLRRRHAEHPPDQPTPTHERAVAPD